MFIIILNYKTDIAEIDKHLVAHRAYLDQGYQNNYLITSGPQKPRVGGILISQLENKAELENFLQNDPFALHQLVEYQVIEFDPIKYHPDFAKFIPTA